MASVDEGIAVYKLMTEPVEGNMAGASTVAPPTPQPVWEGPRKF